MAIASQGRPPFGRRAVDTEVFDGSTGNPPTHLIPIVQDLYCVLEKKSVTPNLATTRGVKTVASAMRRLNCEEEH